MPLSIVLFLNNPLWLSGGYRISTRFDPALVRKVIKGAGYTQGNRLWQAVFPMVGIYFKPLRRLFVVVTNIQALDHKNRVFRDVRRVIPDPLQIPGDQ